MNDISLTEKSLSTPLEQTSCLCLRGVGPSLFEHLQRCGIETLQDLLFHLPLRYQDRTKLCPFNQLRVGDTVLVEGTIKHVQIKFKPRRSLLCHLEDDSGVLLLRFFHFSESQKSKLQLGMQLRAFGEVRGFGSHRELIHPEYKIITKKLSAPPIDTQLTPVYPSTAGLSQKSLNNLTDQVLKLLNQKNILKEYLPDLLLKKYHLPSLTDALNYVHRPPAKAPAFMLEAGTHPMQQRLAFEELLAHHLSLKKNKRKIENYTAPTFPQKTNLISEFLKQLPFELTHAQQRVAQEIENDLKKKTPMMRLLQGDVGSGKTVIAALTALQALENHYQVALLAPTEILAEQHFYNFEKWFSRLNIKILFLTGNQKGKERREALEKIATTPRTLVIGTHALFQENVIFENLGLLIIDEQHRFGVRQRLALHDKAKQFPHQLIMSATPIPRTLAMVAYADLDQSIIDELPPGRIPIATSVISQSHRQEIILRIREQCHLGKQAYWICTLIEESENLQCQTATDTFMKLQQILPECSIGLIHGRCSFEEKQQTMDAFRQNKINLLVSTTVIEVGVDVPNASLMVIENAERLGLSQLHQLRGRIGRGTVASHCVLLYQSPLSALARERLKVMRQTQNGFVIAQRDLELRGPGELLGTRQTGLIPFRIADITRDKKLIPYLQEAATLLEKTAPEKIPLLIRRWLNQKEQYIKV
ncbi:MAG: ATP-dependent DNA helicase RecG [Gammaproteobacteria bacterium RIFCSPLOWO2_02_FULL_38_11]|nr:MAG: ATP-dependent DNA helicase RecG [Gammaproteobacteria bacterium RIFCSPLOWO2_02_FULL_38_11]